jgi:predicted phosphodiesterase
MPFTKGIFISDIHMPDNIRLEPIFQYIRDFQPNVIFLGGDIIDAKGMHGVESMRADQVDKSLYERDCLLIQKLFSDLDEVAPKASFVYLEGNHEERYTRLAHKYPKAFPNVFNLERDAIPASLKKRVKWVPYGTYDSYYVIGDTLFTHGNIWPDLHAKAYALRYTPWKVVYGHLHHFQAYTTHRATLDMSPRYAVTAGCLCNLAPDYKKGEAHQWVHGFIDFVSDGKVTVPNPILIQNNQFHVGGKVYK